MTVAENFGQLAVRESVDAARAGNARSDQQMIVAFLLDELRSRIIHADPGGLTTSTEW